MESIEKINEQLKKLYEADHALDFILEKAGQDSETKYTQEYLDLIDNVKDLRNGLKALLENHNSTVLDVEYEAERG